MAVDRTIVATEKAPAAIGPYAQANIVGDLVFVSGQIPLDPETGELVEPEICAQTERALSNVKAILAAADAGLEDVVKTTVFLADIADFAEMNAVYARFFTGEMLPSRSAVQAAALPKGALVEIEGIAVRRV